MKLFYILHNCESRQSFARRPVWDICRDNSDNLGIIIV